MIMITYDYNIYDYVITCARFCLKANVATDEGNSRNEP